MNKQIVFLFLLYLPWSAAAQSNATIHARFTAVMADTCSVRPSQYFIDEYEKSFKASSVNGEMTIRIPVAKPTVVQLICNNQSIPFYVEPADELEVNIGADSLQKSVSFTGKGGVHNEFLSAFYKTFANDFNKTAINNAILSTDADAFEMKLFDERKKQLAFYSSYKDKNLFTESFRQYIENTIRYNYYARLLSYPIIQANQSAQILTVKAFPPVMLEGIDSKLVSDDALNCETYRDFIYYYVMYFTSEANGFNKFRDPSTSMESKVVTATKRLSGQTLIWYIASFLNSDVDKVSPYTASHIYSVLGSTEKNGTYTKLLGSKVQARLARKDLVVNDKQGANDATTSSKGSFPKLKDLDGKYFTFDDLKGKVVYVDYWASWCGPCRNEMPYSKQLHAMFTPQQLKQVVFLYISIDADESAWKNAVQQIGMEGKLGISPGNWSSEIAKYFQINSIPRYMLIDKKGNIVDLNAKRPSSGQQIYDDIVKLLE